MRLHALGDIAEINLEGYGLDLLKAGTNLSDKSAEVLLDLDAKSFPMNGKNSSRCSSKYRRFSRSFRSSS